MLVSLQQHWCLGNLGDMTIIDEQNLNTNDHEPLPVSSTEISFILDFCGTNVQKHYKWKNTWMIQARTDFCLDQTVDSCSLSEKVMITHISVP